MKRNGCGGRPDAASAVVTADGPGTLVTAMPASIAATDEAVAGIADKGVPASLTRRHVLAGPQPGEQLERAPCLVVVVVADRASLDAVVAREGREVSRVLGGDHGDRAKESRARGARSSGLPIGTATTYSVPLTAGPAAVMRRSLAAPPSRYDQSRAWPHRMCPELQRGRDPRSSRRSRMPSARSRASRCSTTPG